MSQRWVNQARRIRLWTVVMAVARARKNSVQGRRRSVLRRSLPQLFRSTGSAWCLAFTGWGGELAACRKFAPTARNYTASKLMSQFGLRVSEACGLDLDDIKWHRGRFGKLHVRYGKGARRSGPPERWCR